MNAKIVKGACGAFRSYGKAAAFIRQAFECEAPRDTLQAIADELAPKDKDDADGKRIYASMRATVSREAKERGKVVSFKGGVVTISDAAPEASAEEAKGEEEQTGDSPDGIGLDDEAAQEALWAAVELVTGSLENKAVRVALAEALARYAKEHKG